MTDTLQDGLFSLDNAEFSPCRNWRYTLHRRWDDGPSVAFLMLNPSTADEWQDDPTIRKCRGFAQRWGYGRMVIVNLFAIRGTDPRIVMRVTDPVGPMNDFHIVDATIDCREVIAAWGCGQHIKKDRVLRPGAVMSLLADRGVDVRCLGYSADGSPRHPLMLAYATERQNFVLKETRLAPGGKVY